MNKLELIIDNPDYNAILTKSLKKLKSTGAELIRSYSEEQLIEVRVEKEEVYCEEWDSNQLNYPTFTDRFGQRYYVKSTPIYEKKLVQVFEYEQAKQVKTKQRRIY